MHFTKYFIPILSLFVILLAVSLCERANCTNSTSPGSSKAGNGGSNKDGSSAIKGSSEDGSGSSSKEDSSGMKGSSESGSKGGSKDGSKDSDSKKKSPSESGSGGGSKDGDKKKKGSSGSGSNSEKIEAWLLAHLAAMAEVDSKSNLDPGLVGSFSVASATGLTAKTQISLLTDTGLFTNLTSFMISMLAFIEYLLSLVQYYSLHMTAYLSSTAYWISSYLSIPEETVVSLIGDFASTMVSSISSVLYYIPLIGGFIESTGTSLGVCIDKATERLANTIPNSITSCLMTPPQSIRNTIYSISNNLKRSTIMVQSALGSMYMCSSMACRITTVISNIASGLPEIMSLFYNIITGIITGVLNVGSIVPCIGTQVPITIVGNVIGIGVEISECMAVF